MSSHVAANTSRNLTVPQTAQEIGISEDSVWRLIAKGEIPSLRVPSTSSTSRAARVLVPRAGLEDALRRWRVPADV